MAVHRFANHQLITGAADAIAVLIHECVAARGVVQIALAGGATPIPLYHRLAMMALPWERVELWFGDERAVPPDHPMSNYLMVRTALFDEMTDARVHRIQGEMDPVSAATAYERELVDKLGVPPQLDLVLLGLGPDGHTASLFPHTPALAETERWVVANRTSTGEARITLTAKTICAARHVRFFVLGESKASVLAEVLEGPRDPDRLPSQLIATAETDVGWFVDEAAAAQLRSTP